MVNDGGLRGTVTDEPVVCPESRSPFIYQAVQDHDVHRRIGANATRLDPEAVDTVNTRRYSENSTNAHEFTRDEACKLEWQAARRVACRGWGKPTKAAVPLRSHTDLAQDADSRPANSHVGMLVCDGRWSVASTTPRHQSWEKSVPTLTLGVGLSPK
ncbi:hypothetical protein CYV19_01185 [Natronobacterium gregoryi SP2]|uniref:Uncharacterized protein n=1 Tax=Natronobacterium gregoryi (strain ATCC 43098 / DSM 3393 / CCM 3738 / CIP 104747 / IAM 13177 / JCM 8860 / NBRC 102187 / NCIMB 2189 / SP2) TaxID=797304 RepID=L9XSM2_NATGS|nr:hypothetical protein C490_15299 [Natronobacterium gregoryi SP2]PLK22034.1 hypothetical protein CYV19_01185 [Natronobacterium gregoryi SP2]